MAKAFSVASWNVEHFGAAKAGEPPTKPIQPIIDFVVQNKADVIALFEVESAVVFQPLVDALPGYQFHITEGEQIQEILIGIKKGMSGFITQKLEFKSGQSTLRPGVLVTLTVDGKHYPMVFLHLKSLTDPKGFGLRDDMTQRALEFRKVLDKVAPGGTANYLFCGDLNTMGMNLTFSPQDLTGEQEIQRLKDRAASNNFRMKVLDKSHPTTFFPGSTSSLPASNLDHVVAAEHLQFKTFGGGKIDVRGWPQESTDAKRDAWIKKFSDHALLFFEVQKV